MRGIRPPHPTGHTRTPHKKAGGRCTTNDTTVRRLVAIDYSGEVRARVGGREQILDVVPYLPCDSGLVHRVQVNTVNPVGDEIGDLVRRIDDTHLLECLRVVAPFVEQGFQRQRYTR